MGREVPTGFHSRSASAMVAGVAASSTPSSYDVAPTTTWSGTTRISRSSVKAVGSIAVESVTSATVRDMGAGYRQRGE